jgi:hypothetical protein
MNNKIKKTLFLIYGWQIIFILIISCLGRTCPAWLTNNVTFLTLYAFPFIFIKKLFSEIEINNRKVLTAILIPIGSIVILIGFGLIGSFFSLAVFDTFSLEGIQ